MSSKQYLVKFNELSICTGPLDGHLHDVWRRRHGRHRPWRWKHKPSARISETTHLQHIYTAQESLRCCFLVAVALCSPIGSQCITSLLCISVTSPAVAESQKLNDVRWLWISYQYATHSLQNSMTLTCFLTAKMNLYLALNLYLSLFKHFLSWADKIKFHFFYCRCEKSGVSKKGL